MKNIRRAGITLAVYSLDMTSLPGIALPGPGPRPVTCGSGLKVLVHTLMKAGAKREWQKGPL